MNKSNKNLSPFEEQLTQSAHRLRNEQNYQLPLRPYSSRNTTWKWLSAVAAAAIAGWVIGFSFPLKNQIPDHTLLAHTKTDTVVQFQEKVVRDTVVREVRIPVTAVSAVSSSDKVRKQRNNVGCNMECDGVDYDLLITP